MRKMRKTTLVKALNLLNYKMAKANVYAELAIFDGAAMCLSLDARGQTHGFVSQNNDVTLFGAMSNLIVYVASPAYLLAMKVMASRTESDTDSKDLSFLIRSLNIHSVDQAIDITTQYFPMQRIPQRAFYLLESLLETL